MSAAGVDLAGAALHVVVGLLAIAGIVYYWGFVRQLPAPRALPPLGLADAAAAIALATWFILVIASSSAAPPVITAGAILASSVLYLGLVGGIAGFVAVRGLSPVALFGLRWPAWRRELPTTLLALAAAVPVILVAQWAGSLVGSNADNPQPLLEFWRTQTGLEDRATVLAMAVIVAPLAEEALFRGYLLNVAKRFVGRWAALVVTSLLFAAVHVHLPALPGLFLLAMMFGLLYERTGSLWAPVSAHAVFNAASLAAALVWPEAV